MRKMDAGEAVLKLSGDADSLKKTLHDAERGLGSSLKRMGQGMRSVGRKMTLIGGAVTGALGASLYKFTQFGDSLDKMSKRTGVSAQNLGELSHALQISGSNLTEFEMGVRRMQRAVTEAGVEGQKAAQTYETKLAAAMEKVRKAVGEKKGVAAAYSNLHKVQRQGAAVSGTYTEALQMLNLNFGNLKGMKPEDQFMLISARLAEVKDASTQAAIAQEIFGRSGTSLLPLIQEGAGGIAKLRAEVSGVNFEQAAKNAADFQDAMQRLKAQASMLSIIFMDKLAPVLTDLIYKKIVPAIKTAVAWVEANKKLAVRLFLVGSAIGALALVLGPVVVALGSFVTVLGGGIQTVAVFHKSMVALNAALGLSKIGLAGSLGLIVGAGGLGYLFGTWLYKMAGNVEGLQEKLDMLGRTAYKVFEAFGGGPEEVKVGAKWKGPVPQMASGGISPGGLTLVGERGPELVNLPRGSRVFNNQQSQQMGSVNVNVSMGGVVVRELADVERISRELGRRMDSRLIARGLRPLTT